MRRIEEQDKVVACPRYQPVAAGGPGLTPGRLLRFVEPESWRLERLPIRQQLEELGRHQSASPIPSRIAWKRGSER